MNKREYIFIEDQLNLDHGFKATVIRMTFQSLYRLTFYQLKPINDLAMINWTLRWNYWNHYL